MNFIYLEHTVRSKQAAMWIYFEIDFKERMRIEQSRTEIEIV